MRKIFVGILNEKNGNVTPFPQVLDTWVKYFDQNT